MFDLTPGVSNSYEVRMKMGEPTMQWNFPDGSSVLEYARTPMDSHNYMVTIDARNIVRKIEQTLTSGNFKKVKTGMTSESIRRLLGKPAHIEYYASLQEEMWDWRVDLPEGGGRTYFNVHFDNGGHVIATSYSDDSGR